MQQKRGSVILYCVSSNLWVKGCDNILQDHKLIKGVKLWSQCLERTNHDACKTYEMNCKTWKRKSRSLAYFPGTISVEARYNQKEGKNDPLIFKFKKSLIFINLNQHNAQCYLWKLFPFYFTLLYWILAAAFSPILQ